MENSGTYVEYAQLIVLFGLIAVITHAIARSRQFFSLPIPRPPLKNPLSFLSVIAVFAIYLIMSILTTSILGHLAKAYYASLGTPPPLVVMGWIQLTVICMTLFFFYLYAKTLDPVLVRQILKDRTAPYSKGVFGDMCIGALTWVISFPLVVAVGQLTDMLLHLFTGFESYEQVAVRYLKMALSSPPLLTVALFTILLAAPAIEEFLFRGFLQTFFKRFMSVRCAIILSSLCFALFHLSSSQGIGNISLVITLFTFALYLGFIYEKQSSLFASFALHATFNGVSAFRILFFPDS
jgi:membrane protease YdiL (CAAX protease family)